MDRFGQKITYDPYHRVAKCVMKSVVSSSQIWVGEGLGCKRPKGLLLTCLFFLARETLFDERFDISIHPWPI